MKIEYTVPLWGIIVFVFPLLIALATAILRFINRQSDHGKRLFSLETKQDDHKKDMDKKLEEHKTVMDQKHDQLVGKIEKLDNRFNDQRLDLQDIKTKLELLLNHQIQINAPH